MPNDLSPIFPASSLTPAESERLYKLVEECAEVIQVAMKVLLHGYEKRHPDSPTGPTNREELEREFGDVRFQMILLCCANDLNRDQIHLWAHEKGIEIRQYVHHQERKLLDQAQKAAK